MGGGEGEGEEAGREEGLAMVSKPSKVSFSPPRVMLAIGVSTTAVPHAATSAKLLTSLHSTGRSSTCTRSR